MPFLILIITVLGSIVYANSFHCPFQYDDKIYVINNIAIRHIHDLAHIWNYCPCRFVTFLSIALDYHFHQLNVFGYHLFNLAVHLGCAILVWWLVLLTLATPAMKNDKITRHAPLIALLTGLVFVSHPLQTEAVTYIWQRATSLASFFYLASLCFYVKSRSDRGKVFYYLSLVSAILAMFTKEIAITLPLMILLYEYSFLKTGKKIEWKHVLPFLLTIFIIPVTLLITASNSHQIRGTAPEEFSKIPVLHYLLTQFKVMITYIRLSFLPLNQNIDYDYPVYKNILEPPVLFSLLSLMIVLYAAIRLFKKYRLVSFSMFWFFLTLLPESSLMPLQDVIFEHRLYLPLAGYGMFLTGSLYYLWGENNFKSMVKVMVLVIGCYSLLTFQRNKIWASESALWGDAAVKSPHKERPFNNLGLAMAGQRNFAQAIADYDKAIEINPLYINAYVNRALIYTKLGAFTQALADYSKAITLNPKLAEAYISRGNVYYKQGHWDQAIADYTRAVALKPDAGDTYYNLGFIYAQQGRWADAIANYSKAIAINPQDKESYQNRAVCYYHLKENH